MNQSCQGQSNLLWTGVRKLTPLPPVGCFSHLLPRRKSSLCKTYFPNSLSWPLPRTPTHPLWQPNCSLDQREFIRQLISQEKKQKCFLNSKYIPIHWVEAVVQKQEIRKIRVHSSCTAKSFQIKVCPYVRKAYKWLLSDLSLESSQPKWTAPH